jgi:type VI secretion system protein ImpL
LERSLHGHAEDSRFGVRPERRAQLDQIQQEFSAAVESLKRSKLGQGRLGQSALYALPWYVVIGPPAAGKTTAIAASGLDFPLGTNRIRGIGGTRNCDWFFSTSAIFLDTAGRYAVESEDREEWFKFLDLLKTHRRRTPVNGVIVMVSVDELLGFTSADLQQAASDLRARIDELTQRLGVRFPVYLVFTKCDLIRGFADFFADLTPKESEQVWGCTFRSGEDGDDVGTRFEREFDLLTETVVGRRTLRIAGVATPDKTSAEIYLFPLEFAAVGETLSRFVRQLFQTNPYREDPNFRGFYFTSALQEGPPADRVLSSINRRFGLSGSSDRPAVRGEGRSRFLASLFRDIIIHDQNRVAPTSRSLLTPRQMRRLSVASIVVLLLGFGWMARSAFARSSADMLMVQSAVQVSDKPAALDSLYPLASAIDSLEQSPSAARLFGGMGLDRSGKLIPALNRRLVDRAVPLFRELAFVPTEERLRNFSGQSASEGDRGAAYDDLRAYLLVGADVGRLQTSPLERTFLKAYLRRATERRPSDSVLTNRFVSQLQRAVMQTDSQLVDRTRRVLYTPPTVEGLYRGIREEGTQKLPAVPLARLIGAGPSAVFASGAQVSGLYTKEGWESYVQAAIESRSREPAKANWVIGSRPEALPAELANSDSLAGRLIALYFHDYIAEWRRFLVNIRYPQGDRATSIRQLDVLQDVDRSPLLVLLDTVAEQTRFDSPAKKKANDFVSSILKKFGYEAQAANTGASGNPVDRAFASIHALRGPALGQILGQYQDAGAKLQSVGDGAPSSSGAEQLARDLQTARINVNRSAKSLDDDIREALFTQPLDIARAALKISVSSAVMGQWRRQVCAPFDEKLIGRYPFTRRASTDAALLEVERYFRPQSGTVWAFYERELADYARPGDFQVKAGAPIQPGVGTTLRKAKAIGDGLFDGSGGIHLDFDVTPQPPTVEMLTSEPNAAVPTVTQVSITIDGQTSVYQMGRQTPKPFDWPNSKADERGASIAVTVARVGRGAITLPAKESRGDWGWVRLLDDATVSSLGGGNFRLVWKLVDSDSSFAVNVAYVVHARSGQNLIASPRAFFQYDCSP